MPGKQPPPCPLPGAAAGRKFQKRARNRLVLVTFYSRRLAAGTRPRPPFGLNPPGFSERALGSSAPGWDLGSAPGARVPPSWDLGVWGW